MQTLKRLIIIPNYRIFKLTFWVSHTASTTSRSSQTDACGKQEITSEPQPYFSIADCMHVCAQCLGEDAYTPGQVSTKKV